MYFMDAAQFWIYEYCQHIEEFLLAGGQDLFRSCEPRTRKEKFHAFCRPAALTMVNGFDTKNQGAQANNWDMLRHAWEMLGHAGTLEF